MLIPGKLFLPLILQTLEVLLNNQHCRPYSGRGNHQKHIMLNRAAGGRAAPTLSLSEVVPYEYI